MASIQRPALPGTGVGILRFPRVPRARRWLLASIIVLVGAAMLQVNQFSRLTSTGYEMERLKLERAEKLAVNHQLEADVARLSSLGHIDWTARVELEMVPATSRLYIDVNQPVPAHDTLPTRYRPAESPVQAPPADDDRSLAQRLRGLLPF